MSVKSRSIFTPIDESRSILSQHWNSSTSVPESTRSEPALANRTSSSSIDSGRNDTIKSPPQPHNNSIKLPPSDKFTPPTGPPSRTNSLQIGGKRPRLKVQIPDEPSDGGEATGASASSPRESTDTGSHPSRRGGPGTDGSHSSGVVLPPPSPSASALLSAGASGPPNPFARPHPPNQGGVGGAVRGGNDIETPISALPSRFMTNELLPSPSSFYPEWSFRGGDGNTLPSPLNFATPIVGSGPSFLHDTGGIGKRKSPDIDEGGAGAVEAKRLKYEA